MQDCRKCRDYRDCPGKPWFSYQEIKFCPFQILWLIENLGPESWPPNPGESNYIDPGIKTGYASEGYFAKAAGVRGEINYRLKKCGKDGKILRLEAEKGTCFDNLEPEAKDALMYCKGWRRKRMGYQRWLRHRRYQGKKLTKTTTKGEENESSLDTS